MYFFARVLGRHRPRGPHELNIALQLRLVAAFVLLMLSLHVVAMRVFEHLGFGDAIWLTLTTVFTVGYGDLSAHTLAGRISTVVLIYFGAIFVLAQVAALSFDLRQRRRTAKLHGSWRWRMRDHILIINAPSSKGDTYLRRLLTQLRSDPDYRDSAIQILTTEFPQGLSESLRELGAVHRTGSPHSAEDLEAVDIRHAAHVVLLAPDEHDVRSDSLNFDILHRIRELYTGARILVEAVDDDSRERFRRYGAHTILRPMRTYPELLVRAMAAPGTEEVFEEMLLPGGSLTRRYNLKVAGRRWGELVTAFMEAGIGTALAYVERGTGVVSNPDPNAVVNAHGLILLVRPGRPPSRADVMRVVDGLSAAALPV